MLKPRGQRTSLRPPVAYYGGKRHWATEVWRRLGDPQIYSEPFAGMLGVLLGRPTTPRIEIVCDLDAMVCNFWRALKSDPAGLLEATLWPAIHHDLIARRRACCAWAADNAARLAHDTEFCDVRIAGWWAWGVNVSVKRIFTSSPPPEKGLGSKPGIFPAGVHARAYSREEAQGWLDRLAARLERVIVMSGDWRQAVAPGSLGGGRFDSVGVLLDPPYRTDNRAGRLYASDKNGQCVASEAYEWALEWGRRWRIAYCCAEGDFECPEGWQMLRCEFLKSWMTEERVAAYKDAVFFSPACLTPQDDPTLL